MKYNYKVPCRKVKLREIRSFVKNSLLNHGISEIDISTLVLAIDEVCANLMIHSHQCNPLKTIALEIIIDKKFGVEFNIIDNSEMFNINDYEEPTLDDLIKKQRKGGIGLILVKRIMDDIQIITKGSKYICRLTKKLDMN